MQQITDLRKRWGDRGQWVQLGVVSASVLAPLLSRWNELRAAERARDLRVQAEERLRDVRGRFPRGKREAQQQLEEIVRQATGGDVTPTRRVSTTLWLVGVGLGLAAAGAGAYVLVRRQMRLNAEGPLVELPASANGHRAPAGRDEMNGRAAAQPATAASRTGPAGADSAVSALADQAAAPVAAASDAIPGPAPATAPGSAAGADDAAEARFIGNIHTMVYHEADADPAELPSEENRVYFLTEEAARADGYRRDREEVAPSGGEAEAQAGE